MEKKNYLILDNEFLDYCKLNNIEDVNKKGIETFKRGFTILKYGEIPSYKEVNKEPAIKEVYVDRIIEKEVFISNNEIETKLIDENKTLKKEIQNLKIELDRLTKLKYSNNNDLYDE